MQSMADHSHLINTFPGAAAKQNSFWTVMSSDLTYYPVLEPVLEF